MPPWARIVAFTAKSVGAFPAQLSSGLSSQPPVAVILLRESSGAESGVLKIHKSPSPDVLLQPVRLHFLNKQLKQTTAKLGQQPSNLSNRWHRLLLLRSKQSIVSSPRELVLSVRRSNRRMPESGCAWHSNGLTKLILLRQLLFLFGLGVSQRFEMYPI